MSQRATGVLLLTLLCLGHCIDTANAIQASRLHKKLRTKPASVDEQSIALIEEQAQVSAAMKEGMMMAEKMKNPLIFVGVMSTVVKLGMFIKRMYDLWQSVNKMIKTIERVAKEKRCDLSISAFQAVASMRIHGELAHELLVANKMDKVDTCQPIMAKLCSAVPDLMPDYLDQTQSVDDQRLNNGLNDMERSLRTVLDDPSVVASIRRQFQLVHDKFKSFDKVISVPYALNEEQMLTRLRSANMARVLCAEPPQKACEKLRDITQHIVKVTDGLIETFRAKADEHCSPSKPANGKVPDYANGNKEDQKAWARGAAARDMMRITLGESVLQNMLASAPTRQVADPRLQQEATDKATVDVSEGVTIPEAPPAPTHDAEMAQFAQSETEMLDLAKGAADIGAQSLKLVSYFSTTEMPWVDGLADGLEVFKDDGDLDDKMDAENKAKTAQVDSTGGDVTDKAGAEEEFVKDPEATVKGIMSAVNLGADLLMGIAEMLINWHLKKKLNNAVMEGYTTQCTSLKQMGSMITQVQRVFLSLERSLQTLLEIAPKVALMRYTPEVHAQMKYIYMRVAGDEVFALEGWRHHCDVERASGNFRYGAGSKASEEEQKRYLNCQAAVRIVKSLIDPDMSDTFKSLVLNERDNGVLTFVLAMQQMLKTKIQNVELSVEADLRATGCFSLDYDEQLRVERSIIFAQHYASLKQQASNMNDRLEIQDLKAVIDPKTWSAEADKLSETCNLKDVIFCVTSVINKKCRPTEGLIGPKLRKHLDDYLETFPPQGSMVDINPGMFKEKWTEQVEEDATKLEQALSQSTGEYVYHNWILQEAKYKHSQSLLPKNSLWDAVLSPIAQGCAAYVEKVRSLEAAELAKNPQATKTVAGPMGFLGPLKCDGIVQAANHLGSAQQSLLMGPLRWIGELFYSKTNYEAPVKKVSDKVLPVVMCDVDWEGGFTQTADPATFKPPHNPFDALFGNVKTIGRSQEEEENMAPKTVTTTTTTNTNTNTQQQGGNQQTTTSTSTSTTQTNTPTQKQQKTLTDEEVRERKIKSDEVLRSSWCIDRKSERNKGKSMSADNIKKCLEVSKKYFPSDMLFCRAWCEVKDLGWIFQDSRKAECRTKCEAELEVKRGEVKDTKLDNSITAVLGLGAGIAKKTKL